MFKITRIVKHKNHITTGIETHKSYLYDFYFNDSQMASSAVMGENLANSLAEQLGIEMEYYHQ